MDHGKNIAAFLNGLLSPSAKASPFPAEVPSVNHVRAFRPLNNTRDAQLKKAAEEFKDLPFEANAAFIDQFVTEFRAHHEETAGAYAPSEFITVSHLAKGAKDQ